MDFYLLHHKKDNLLNSIFLSLFISIRSKNLSEIVLLFGNKYKGKIDEMGLDKKKIFKDLLTLHE